MWKYLRMSNPRSINSSVREGTRVVLRETTASLHNSSPIQLPRRKVFTYIYTYMLSLRMITCLQCAWQWTLYWHIPRFYRFIMSFFNSFAFSLRFYCKQLCRRTPINKLNLQEHLETKISFVSRVGIFFRGA